MAFLRDDCRPLAIGFYVRRASPSTYRLYMQNAATISTVSWISRSVDVARPQRVRTMVSPFPDETRKVRGFRAILLEV